MENSIVHVIQGKFLLDEGVCQNVQDHVQDGLQDASFEVAVVSEVFQEGENRSHDVGVLCAGARG